MLKDIVNEPDLKQFRVLTADDFRRHRVWGACHSFDHEEPWFDNTDEETFRPWSRACPADPSKGMFLVACDATLADGSRLQGFLTPSAERGRQEADALGIVQPHLFLPSGKAVGFWGGLIGIPQGVRSQLYQALDRTPDQVFPMRFAAFADVATGLTEVTVRGFYRLESLRSGAAVVEK